MWFEAEDPKDAEYLAQFDVWGGVPKTPVCLPGIGRYGHYKFDKHLLLQKSDLTVAQKKEVIFLCEHFHKIDHFEFFAIQATTDSKKIKKAYFKFSKRFHPDCIKGKNLGVLNQHLPLLFQYGQYIYQLLIENEHFLHSYATVTQQRDQSFRAQLEAERQHMQQQLQIKQQQKNDPLFTSKARSAEKLKERKEYLRKRISHNQQKRSQVAKKEQYEQAKLFYQEGIQAESRNQLTRAFNHFKLAADYQPESKDYHAALIRTRQALADQEAEKIWVDAETWVATEMWDRAFPLHQQSLEISLHPQRILTFCTYYQDQHIDQCDAWLTKACQRWIHDLDLKWQHTQILVKKNQFREAIAMAQNILSSDPSEPRALKFIKKYKHIN